ncbi:MAG TPA: hypothetical protein VHE35_35860 [Kofleriaceae bacterium]|nr:hypothetical protein [Kofleriaceae bacterium]
MRTTLVSSMTLAAALAGTLAACAHPHAPARPGPDATVDGARRLAYDDPHPLRGTVNARAGDRIDWYVFEMDEECTSVGLDLRVKAARAPARLRVDVVDPRGEPHGRVVSRHGTLRIENAPLGHYHVAVAIEGDDAARYMLVARDARTGFECGDLPPPRPLNIERVPAVTLPPAPPGMLAVTIGAWETWSERDRDGVPLARLMTGYLDGVDAGESGPAVDAHGTPVPGVELKVLGADRHTALAELRGTPPDRGAIAGALLRFPPPPPPPLTVDVIDRWRGREGVMVELDAGEIEGVAGGWRGPILDADGHPLADLVVLRADARHSFARIAAAPLAAILTARKATVSPP